MLPAAFFALLFMALSFHKTFLARFYLCVSEFVRLYVQ
jgi:uncharacterized membrane protein